MAEVLTVAGRANGNWLQVLLRQSTVALQGQQLWSIGTFDCWSGGPLEAENARLVTWLMHSVNRYSHITLLELWQAPEITHLLVAVMLLLFVLSLNVCVFRMPYVTLLTCDNCMNRQRSWTRAGKRRRATTQNKKYHWQTRVSLLRALYNCV